MTNDHIAATRAAVAEGANLLDTYGPPQWRGTINLPKLNMADDHDCILGQLYGSYATGLAALGANVYAGTEYEDDQLDDPDVYGFDLGSGDSWVGYFGASDYVTLTETWRAAVQLPPLAPMDRSDGGEFQTLPFDGLDSEVARVAHHAQAHQQHDAETLRTTWWAGCPRCPL